jgi:hypothetical protein
MFLNPTVSAALDRVAERAADVQRAFTPGALPEHDDVATAGSSSDFTLDPLCVRVPDDAYLVTRDAQGRTAYTRDGAFALRDGHLTETGGGPILGLRAGGSTPAELSVDPVDAALGRVNDPRIEPDGSFVYTRNIVDPRTGAGATQRVTVGRIALARFPAGTRLETSDGIHGFAPPGVAARDGVPGDGLPHPGRGPPGGAPPRRVPGRRPLCHARADAARAQPRGSRRELDATRRRVPRFRCAAGG